MHKIIIELKKDISDEALGELTSAINGALGKRSLNIIKTETNSPYRFEFKADDMQFRFVQIELLQLKQNRLFFDNVEDLRVE